MKTLVPHLFHLLRHRPNRIKVVSLLRFMGFLAALVVVYSILFHFIMAWEGRQHSWVTGFYWTLTVMSALGFGDITFASDLGRIFSSIVLLSGIVMLLVVFPFTFIEFFYAPWMRAQAEARAPSQLPAKTRGHVILTANDAVGNALIERLMKYQYPYVLLVSNLDDALRLNEMGYKVLVGDLDNPETYRRARTESARLVVVTATSDRVNTNVVFTVREATETPPHHRHRQPGRLGGHPKTGGLQLRAAALRDARPGAGPPSIRRRLHGACHRRVQRVAHCGSDGE